ncbi:alcohol dehydrogenase catalytic domain-containing protein [Leucobacter aridicollis]|uniref:S-(Hydroxymethyl)glutathione dehydrogenase/alcohol dehydrogenase n=1 Tax=Leucobacter aridicollis TaxID=283878 RepID=A0A852R9J2_9MICO|nr:alcohol dehydrogenase catalytic domain-containing protein [Leucobacter aridicollis]MBL3681879.1 alcohol dehydrogenase [Leucobacter aridicollis]NYD27079.1 S-(hydroxymethyl)glutathione dehydrogenase/alcohol dehydrogenase [Leucobacter aridicollis]
MKASVTTGVGNGFKTADIELAEPIGREVLVEVKASGLCASDVHIEQGASPSAVFPAVLGHEISGVVSAVGPGVTTIAVGDHVVASLIQFCGACVDCLSGRTYACTHPEATMRSADEPARMTTEAGEPLMQLLGIGGFTERTLIHENQLAVVNKEIPFPQAAVLGCAVSTGAGAAINTAGVKVGDSVAVIGTGGVGLNAISGALLAGATTIIAIDISDEKLAVAKRFGATHVINSSQVDPVAEVVRITQGGVDHSFEIIGLPATQKQAVDMRGVLGTAYFIGIARHGTSLELTTDATSLSGQAGVRTVKMGSTNLKRDIPMYADMYVQGRLNLDDLISQEISIDQVEEGYEALKRGEVIRSVITSF